MRLRRALFLLGLASIVGISLLFLRTPSAHTAVLASGYPSSERKLDALSRPAERPFAVSGDAHPIAQLLRDSKSSWDNVRSRQSKTLADAVKEYRRRYKLPPPPHFDVWFDFAKTRGVEMIDEYDTIYHSLLPFWGLPPKVLRARVKEALGYGNHLIGVLIRNGNITLVEGEEERDDWKREALAGMMEQFVKYLPNMDLAFNALDEPRVVIPSEDLQRLVSHALDTVIPTIGKEAVDNRWTNAADLNKGDRFDEVRTTRFNSFSHQRTWAVSRSSCSVDTPARDLNETVADQVGGYSFSDLGFVHNITAFSDICFSPSLRHSFGLFDRPHAMSVVHDLFPIFSESKISSFQDILYPSPWYWAGKVPYDPANDTKWDNKIDQMYWRGSTTGGYSRAGGWRRHHRQSFVKKLHSPSEATILEQNEGRWAIKTVDRSTFKPLLNVSFSHVGQCEPEDCDAQARFFNIVDMADQQNAWSFKYLLDLDGNAFSGRFYALLRSNSLVYKLAVFREWHSEWIKPWVHYIPLSLKGDDYIEGLRYFAQEEEGRRQAPLLAQESSNWARKALTNDALEVWFFRLLLEYGRVIDDNREKIGFSLS